MIIIYNVGKMELTNQRISSGASACVGGDTHHLHSLTYGDKMITATAVPGGEPEPPSSALEGPRK